MAQFQAISKLFLNEQVDTPVIVHHVSFIAVVPNVILVVPQKVNPFWQVIVNTPLIVLVSVVLPNVTSPEDV